MNSRNRKPKQKTSSKSESKRQTWSHIVVALSWIIWLILYLPIALFKLILILAKLSPIPFERIKSRKDMLAAFILFCMAFVIVIGEFIVPGTQPFEANLLVSHIQFITPEPNSRFFLQNIDRLTSLDLQTPSETLTLRGSFSSPDNPQINSILSQKTELSFTFPESNSHLFVYPATPQGLALPELTLKSILQINLSYLAYPPETQLNLRLTSTEKEATESLATLQLKLNPEAFTLGLENVKIENLDLPVTELQFTPNAPLTRQISLFSPTQLALTFAENTQPKRDWIRGNLPVTDVNLTWLERTGDIQNDLPRSSVIKGEVRMKSKTLILQEHQFLIAADAQDIEKLRYFTLNSDPDEGVGVQVRLAGKSKKLAVGLDPDYPVQTLNASWLSRYLTPDQITAALSFAAAVIGFLLPYLFTMSPEN
ncbi:hypothetical protein PJF56_13210 [Roseofilum sp. BLCC_M91]|uniref:Uncharacterized protein n=1 Tax=Roseofilum halophilum BLCC-M91 TaxID=3022259 RepID=A0ABT7BL88_9CYAN|nr:hypothetical protein [Roseofilum halophilum]MDJ1179825.1 hypothetical protein [Roseofilum halophilum BLCC-M91]